MMPPSGEVVTLQIDGEDVSAHSEDTVLEVARENGVFIPRLCQIDGLSVVGACRLCLVEIEGNPKLMAACVTKVAEGMRIHTHSERLQQYRRRILEMLFAEGNHICSVCVSNGHCELQALGQKVGMTHSRLPWRYNRRGVDSSHERFRLDRDRCILCTRCVRVCAEIEGAHTWDVMGRGIDASLIADLNEPWGDSETCTSCGKCVNVCPTGALSNHGTSVGEMTKKKQFLPYLTQMRGTKHG